ncbi:unnamed protein product, partial [Polarella glacialis]
LVAAQVSQEPENHLGPNTADTAAAPERLHNFTHLDGPLLEIVRDVTSLEEGYLELREGDRIICLHKGEGEDEEGWSYGRLEHPAGHPAGWFPTSAARLVASGGSIVC